jgi:quercetin dioxygenase-like cupin family protein
MNQPANTNVKILVGTESSANRVAVIESVERPYSEPPCHRHHWEDKLFYVISGEMAVLSVPV